MTGNLQRHAVFLDRDGVLNDDPGYVYRTEDLKLLPEVASSLKRLSSAGFVLIVITNQAGIARGKFTIADTNRFNTALAEEIARKSGASIAGFYICPHHPEGTVKEFAIVCECRKPGTKLVQQAAIDHGIDLSKSYFIGDRESDVECGLRAGMTSIQVRSAGGFKSHPTPSAFLSDLGEAATWIINR